MITILFTNDFFDHYRLLDVTDEIIEQAEKKLKVQLPIDYVDLMKRQNGGELINRKLVVDDEVVSIDYISGIGQKTGEGILLSTSLKREWGLSNRLVYLFGDGHTWIAFDYRRYKGNEPPVIYVDLETEKQIRLADSFQEFIDSLQYDETLARSTYDFGSELEKYPREEVEQEMEKCRYAGIMSSGIEYYLFTDDDLTWAFTQLSTYVDDWMEEGYEYYKKPERTPYLLTEFLDMIIAIIRKKNVDLLTYPIALELLHTLANFPENYDDGGIIRNKALKIKAFFHL